jgi:hypothetical protein
MGSPREAALAQEQLRDELKQVGRIQGEIRR